MLDVASDAESSHRDANPMTSLQLASAFKAFSVAQYLVHVGHRCDLGLDGPLSIAAQRGYLNIVELLIPASNYPRLASTHALMALVMSLLPGDDQISLPPRLRHKQDPTAHSALEIMKKLLEAGADASSSISTQEGDYTLLCCVMHLTFGSETDMARLLIQYRAPCDSMTRTAFQPFPEPVDQISHLALAALLGHLGMVELLLSNGVRRFECSDKSVFDTIPIAATPDRMFRMNEIVTLLDAIIEIHTPCLDRFKKAVKTWQETFRCAFDNAIQENWDTYSFDARLYGD